MFLCQTGTFGAPNKFDNKNVMLTNSHLKGHIASNGWGGVSYSALKLAG